MMRRSPALPVLTAAVAALALAGCSSSGASTPSDDETGPMTAFFTEVGGSFEDEDYQEQQRKVEELIVACMSEQGFEYRPSEPMGAVTNDDDIPEWDSKEYAEQYGYGATTSEELYGSGEEYVDPNADYVAGMSESEQTAYYEALWGTEPEVDPEADPDAEVEWNWEDGGCQGAASHEVYEEGQIWDDPALADIMEEMNSEWESIADDPKVREAQKKWSACIAEAGFDFTSPDEAQQSIYDEMNVLWEAAAPTEEQLAADPEASFEPDEAATAELKKKELALAPADFACKESSGWTEAQKSANLALEQRLWEKYGDQLEAAAAKTKSSE